MSNSSLHDRRILVVEDDYMVAQEVRRELQDAGAVVVGPAPSVEIALRLLDSDAVQAAVLDVNLGEEKSFPIARVLTTRNIPFLFSTGYNSGDILPEWRHVTTVTKPLRMAAVEQLLASGDAA